MTEMANPGCILFGKVFAVDLGLVSLLAKKILYDQRLIGYGIAGGETCAKLIDRESRHESENSGKFLIGANAPAIRVFFEEFNASLAVFRGFQGDAAPFVTF